MRTRSTGAAADACSSATGCVAIPLSGTASPIDPDTNTSRPDVPNLMGNPYDQPVTPFDDLRVTTTIGTCSIGGNGCSLAEATLPISGGVNVMGNVAFTYDPTLNGGTGDYVPMFSGSSLFPWQGFWVFELPAAIDNNPVVRFPDLLMPL